MEPPLTFQMWRFRSRLQGLELLFQPLLPTPQVFCRWPVVCVCRRDRAGAPAHLAGPGAWQNCTWFCQNSCCHPSSLLAVNPQSPSSACSTVGLAWASRWCSVEAKSCFLGLGATKGHSPFCSPEGAVELSGWILPFFPITAPLHFILLECDTLNPRGAVGVPSPRGTWGQFSLLSALEGALHFSE